MSNFFMAIDLFVKLMKGDNGEAQYDFRLGFLFKHVNMPNPICGSSPGTPRMATWTRHVTYHSFHYLQGISMTFMYNFK